MKEKEINMNSSEMKNKVKAYKRHPHPDTHTRYNFDGCVHKGRHSHNPI